MLIIPFTPETWWEYLKQAYISAHNFHKAYSLKLATFCLFDTEKNTLKFFKSWSEKTEKVKFYDLLHWNSIAAIL